MKKRALVLLAVCAMVFSAAPARAAAGTCADWEGTWTFTYTGDKTETVTITDICSKPNASTPAPECMPEGAIREAWLCVAKGTKASDSQPVQIRQISYDPSGNAAYYEATDAEILEGGQNQLYDLIPKTSFTSCSFTADEANYGLKSGLKSNCTEPTTTSTTTTAEPEGPCPAQKVLGEDSTDLDTLRSFRDGPLVRSTAGRSITRIYYNNAASINAVLDGSPALRSVARNLFQAVVLLEGNKK